MNDFYKVLGVKAKASPAEIKKAYRDKSKVLHPDVGGNKDEFAMIARAYGVLGDKSKRARYDKTGIEADFSVIKQQACNMIQAIFNDILQGYGIENISTCDIISAIKEKLDQTSDKTDQQKIKAVDEKKALREAIKRIKHKDGNNLFSTVITQRISNQDKEITVMAQRKEVLMIARKILKDYGFEFDETAMGTSPATGTSVTWIKMG